MLKKRLKYLGYSRSCAEMAEAVQSLEQRIMLLHIAETWKRLAATEQPDEQPRLLH
jgi:hypothetical protein